MGSGTWDPGAWSSYSSSVKGKTTTDTFKARSIVNKLDPKGVTMRESRDSADNPESTAIICGLDVTGSMGEVARVMAQEGLGTLFTEIIDRKPVTNPHMMFMAVGDITCDISPLQVSQFEADSRIIEQLSEIYVEGHGGGNNFESYDLPWYFAGAHTSIDCFEKRGKKGYLFTVGDEPAPEGISLPIDKIEYHIGDTLQEGLTAAQALAMAERYYHVFHVHLSTVGYSAHPPSSDYAYKSFCDIMTPQKVIQLSDYKKLAEVIVSTIQVIEGADKAIVAKSWGGGTDLIVRDAIKSLVPVTKNAGAVRRF